MKVESGPEGYAQFLQDVRELFGITADLEMELTFDCAEPATGDLALERIPPTQHAPLSPCVPAVISSACIELCPCFGP